jgi:hypothetical protein
VVERNPVKGMDLASAVLLEMGVEADAIAGWARVQQQRASATPGDALVAA